MQRLLGPIAIWWGLGFPNGTVLQLLGFQEVRRIQHKLPLSGTMPSHGAQSAIYTRLRVYDEQEVLLLLGL